MKSSSSFGVIARFEPALVAGRIGAGRRRHRNPALGPSAIRRSYPLAGLSFRREAAEPRPATTAAKVSANSIATSP